jgi:hypothetical protein
MKKFLTKLFTWIGECAACERAMYEALYDARIAPLLDKINSKTEKILKLENEIADLKAVEVKPEAKPKRKYNKKKKADDKA